MAFQGFPYLSLLGDATEYFYFCRSWWDGIGIDAAMWWRDKGDNYHYWCLVTGESYTVSQRQELARRVIAPEEYRVLTSSAIARGMLTISTQEEEILLTHYDDIVGIKLEDGKTHSYFVRCGRHTDPRDAQIRELVWRHSSELRLFYEQGMKRR